MIEKGRNRFNYVCETLSILLASCHIEYLSSCSQRLPGAEGVFLTSTFVDPFPTGEMDLCDIQPIVVTA